MEVFKPIKVENYQFMKNGLNQYEPVLVYFKDDEEEGKVYFVKNKFDDKLEEWKEEVELQQISIDRFRGLYNRFRKTN